MAGARRRHVSRRSKARTLATVAVPVVGVLAIVGASVAVVIDQDADVPTVSGKPAEDLITAALRSGGQASISRSAERPPVIDETAVKKKIDGQLFATSSNTMILSAASKTAPILGSLNFGESIAVTGRTKKDWTEVVHEGTTRWVLTSDLDGDKPLGTAPCASGSGPERGLQPDTIKVHRAICAQFPSITVYGGVAGRGEHATGRAIDVMVSSDLGTEIAAFAQAHWRELGVSQIIWRQRIWTVERASDGWRSMKSRGGATANHMDHVHITTFGNVAVH